MQVNGYIKQEKGDLVFLESLSECKAYPSCILYNVDNFECFCARKYICDYVTFLRQFYCNNTVLHQCFLMLLLAANYLTAHIKRHHNIYVCCILASELIEVVLEKTCFRVGYIFKAK
jgi:hypothetical protein